MPSPSEIDLVVDAVADLAPGPADIDAVRLAAMDVRSTVTEVGQMVGGLVSISSGPWARAAASRVNVTVTGQRRFASVAEDLARFKAISGPHTAAC